MADCPIFLVFVRRNTRVKKKSGCSFPGGECPGVNFLGYFSRVIVLEPILCSNDFLIPNILAGIKQNIVTIVDVSGFTATGCEK